MATGTTNNIAKTSEAQAGKIFRSNVSEADTTKASDSQAFKLAIQKTQADSALTSEAEAFSLATGGGGPTGTETDTATTSEAEAFGKTLVYAETDTVLASDSEALGQAAQYAQTDTALASDSEALGQAAKYAETDITVTGESEDFTLSSQPSLSFAQTDTAITSEQEALGQAAQYDQADSVLASDSQAYALLVQGLESDVALTMDAYASGLFGSRQTETDTTLCADSYVFALNTGKAATKKAYFRPWWPQSQPVSSQGSIWPWRLK